MTLKTKYGVVVLDRGLVTGQVGTLECLCKCVWGFRFPSYAKERGRLALSSRNIKRLLENSEAQS